MILIDTDHLTVLARTADARHPALVDRLAATGDQTVGITVVSVEEQLRGWLSLIAKRRDVAEQVGPYARLAKLVGFLNAWPIVQFDEAAADAFSRLRRRKIRIGTQDLKIASIALTNDALLLTANAQDFGLVPGLRFEDWLK